MTLNLFLSLLISALFEDYAAEAVIASPHPFRHVQPDGSLSPKLYVTGNHEFHMVMDEKGFTVIDDDNGWKVYGTLNKTSGSLQPTDFRVGERDPFEAVEAGIIGGKMEMPDAQVILQNCGKFCNHRHKLSRGRRTQDHSRLRGSDDGIQDLYWNITLPTGNTGKDGNLSESRKRIRRRTISKKLEVTKGTIRNLVVLITFSDHSNRSLPTPTEISEIMNKLDGSEKAPTGSVRDFFKDSSYGLLNVISDVQPWFQLPESEAYYADKASGATMVYEEAIRAALDNLERRNPSFPFSNYDKDGDEKVDAVMFLVSLGVWCRMG